MAAAEQPITANLDIWSSAIKAKSVAGRGKSSKLELYGIKKLRGLILELAVRGLLLPQDPNDEPASELLKKIAAEKAQLVKDGKIKKPKVLPEIEDDETPFDLPQGWDWARLGDVTSYGTCDKADAKNVESDTWVLELEDVEKVSSRLLAKVRFSERQFRSSKNVFSEGDVIYGKLRPYLDKVLVTDEPGVCTTEMIPVRGYACLSPPFLRLAMKSPSFIAYANDSAHGMNLPRMGTAKARLALIPLLPEAEQARIVAKVDELMALCDQLEQQQETSITAHQALVQTLLDTLPTASERDGFTAAWARIADHFDTLFTTEWSIDQLKQTILQLAVMGKIVPQDPNDEPAERILERAGQRHKENKPTLKQNEKTPFKIPESWLWVKLDNLCKFEQGIQVDVNLQSKEQKRGLIRFLRIVDFTQDTDDDRYIEDPGKKYHIDRNELVMVRYGATAGFAGTGKTGVLANNLFKIKYEPLSLQFVMCFFKTSYFKENLSLSSRSTAMPAISFKFLKELFFPLPPLEEQARIVSKLDELMALCDTLKTHLNTTQTTQLHLADAITEQAVA